MDRQVNYDPKIYDRNGRTHLQPKSMQDMILPGDPLLDQDVNGENNHTIGLGSNLTVDDSDTFLYPAGFDITNNLQDVGALLQYYHQYILPKYQIKRDYYKGRHRSIIERARMAGVDYDNDNRIVNPFPKKLVDTMTRYDTSNPVQVTFESGNETDDEGMNTKLSEWMNSVDFVAQHQRLIKNACLYGRSFMYIYNDSMQNQLKLSVCDPIDTIVVYDNTVAKHPLFAVRDTTNGGSYSGELITVDGTYTFSAGSGVGSLGAPKIDNEKPFVDASGEKQPLPNLPIVEMNIKDEKMGIFDDVITLIDEINETLSTKANDRAAMSLYYMVITGLEMSPEEMQRIKRMHIANIFNPNAIDDDTVNKPSLSFESPEINDELQEHILDRFEHLVFKNSGVLDIYDASVGNSADANSGVAIQKMYSEMQSNAKAIDNNFDELANLIMSILFDNWDMDAENSKFLNYVHTPDDPVNISEQADNFNKLPENMPTQDKLNISGLGGTNSKQLADKMDNNDQSTSQTVSDMVQNAINHNDGGDSHANSK